MEKKLKTYQKSTCPVCREVYDLTRKDKKYCSRKCQSHAARDAKAKSVQRPKPKRVRLRVRENSFRSQQHYSRSAWLTYDIHRLPQAQKSEMIQKLLEAASSHDAKLRNILLDPILLGAGRYDPQGRFSIDRTTGVPNIAKQVYRYCMEQYGCPTKDCILDNGKPAFRAFVGDTIVAKEVTSPELTEKHFRISAKLKGLSKIAYDKMLSSVIEGDESFPVAEAA